MDQSKFEEIYTAVRIAENRIYTDEQVRILPEIDPSHPHFREWQVRERSFRRLAVYLAQFKHPPKMLEIGCGNGWLSARLAKQVAEQVTGIDINSEELEQGSRVFRDIRNLRFVYGDIRKNNPVMEKFDIILFAASLQYFPSLKEILKTVKEYIAESGYVMITDTIFYSAHTLQEASGRTKAYYDSLGFPDAAAYYYHHSIEELKRFNPEFIYRPNFLLNKIFPGRSPFYIVSIQGKYIGD